MNRDRERKADVKHDKSDLWSSYPQYYPAYNAELQSPDKSSKLPLGMDHMSSCQGGILSPLSPNIGRTPLVSSTIKHQPYLDSRTTMNEAVLHGVFADSILEDKQHPNFMQLVHSAYGDSHQITLHGIHSSSGDTLSQHAATYLEQQHHRSPHEDRCDGEEVGGGSSSCSGSSGGSRESSQRLRQETSSQRQERLRKNAERGKLRRLEETEEQRNRRLARNAERGKLRRMEESPDKRSERLKKNAERQKARRNRESPEERQLRLWKNAERQRIRRNTLTGIKIEFSEYNAGIPEHLL